MHVSHRYVQNLSTHSCVLRNHCMEHITESLVVCIGVYKIQHSVSFLSLIYLSLLMLLGPRCSNPNRSTAVETKNASLVQLYQLRYFLLTRYVQECLYVRMIIQLKTVRRHMQKLYVHEQLQCCSLKQKKRDQSSADR